MGRAASDFAAGSTLHPADGGGQFSHPRLRWRVGRSEQPGGRIVRPSEAAHPQGRPAGGRRAHRQGFSIVHTTPCGLNFPKVVTP